MLQKSSSEVLTSLRCLHDRPPNLNVSVSAEVLNSLRDPSKLDPSSLSEGAEVDGLGTADGIDWNISVDASQIDWDVTNEQADESANGFGSYEIISSNGELQDPERENNNTEESLVAGTSESEICWDVTIENPPVDALEDAGQPAAPLGGDEAALELPQTVEGERSQLLDTEYRNKILDDLFEVSY